MRDNQHTHQTNDNKLPASWLVEILQYIGANDNHHYEIAIPIIHEKQVTDFQPTLSALQKKIANTGQHIHISFILHPDIDKHLFIKEQSHRDVKLTDSHINYTLTQQTLADYFDSTHITRCHAVVIIADNIHTFDTSLLWQDPTLAKSCAKLIPIIGYTTEDTSTNTTEYAQYEAGAHHYNISNKHTIRNKISSKINHVLWSLNQTLSFISIFDKQVIIHKNRLAKALSKTMDNLLTKHASPVTFMLSETLMYNQAEKKMISPHHGLNHSIDAKKTMDKITMTHQNIYWLYQAGAINTDHPKVIAELKEQ